MSGYVCKSVFLCFCQCVCVCVCVYVCVYLFVSTSFPLSSSISSCFSRSLIFFSVSTSVFVPFPVFLSLRHTLCLLTAVPEPLSSNASASLTLTHPLFLSVSSSSLIMSLCFSLSLSVYLPISVDPSTCRALNLRVSVYRDVVVRGIHSCSWLQALPTCKHRFRWTASYLLYSTTNSVLSII